MSAFFSESRKQVIQAREALAAQCTSLFVLGTSWKNASERTLADALASAKNGGNKETRFRLFAPWAKNVSLAADFTDWDRSPVKMTRGFGGVWHLKISLPPGQYRYRFLIDIDSQAPAQVSPFPFGALEGVAAVAA